MMFWVDECPRCGTREFTTGPDWWTCNHCREHHTQTGFTSPGLTVRSLMDIKFEEAYRILQRIEQLLIEMNKRNARMEKQENKDCAEL